MNNEKTTLTDSAKLLLHDREYDLPVVVGSEGEVGVDISQLRNKSGAITMDSGYGNTGSCQSSITFIDGEKGILRYRGYPIEELAEKSNFIEVSFLLIFGHLPTKAETERFQFLLTHHSLIHEDMKKFFEGFPPTAHPMGILSSMVSSLSAFYPEAGYNADIELNIIRLLAKLKTIAAFSYKKSIGQPYVYPRNDLSYSADMLHMMFAVPSESYDVPNELEKALDTMLRLKAAMSGLVASPPTATK